MPIRDKKEENDYSNLVYDSKAWREFQATNMIKWGYLTSTCHPWLPVMEDRAQAGEYRGALVCGYLGDNYKNIPRCRNIVQPAKKSLPKPADFKIEAAEPKEYEGKVPSHGFERIERLGADAYVKEPEWLESGQEFGVAEV